MKYSAMLANGERAVYNPNVSLWRGRSSSSGSRGQDRNWVNEIQPRSKKPLVSSSLMLVVTAHISPTYLKPKSPLLWEVFLKDARYERSTTHTVHLIPSCFLFVDYLRKYLCPTSLSFLQGECVLLIWFPTARDFSLICAEFVCVYPTTRPPALEPSHSFYREPEQCQICGIDGRLWLEICCFPVLAE